MDSTTFGATSTTSSSRAHAIGTTAETVGAVLLLVGVLGIFGIATANGSKADFVPLNSAGDSLHLVLGLAMVALGIVVSRDPARATTR